MQKLFYGWYLCSLGSHQPGVRWCRKWPSNVTVRGNTTFRSGRHKSRVSRLNGNDKWPSFNQTVASLIRGLYFSFSFNLAFMANGCHLVLRFCGLCLRQRFCKIIIAVSVSFAWLSVFILMLLLYSGNHSCALQFFEIKIVKFRCLAPWRKTEYWETARKWGSMCNWASCVFTRVAEPEVFEWSRSRILNNTGCQSRIFLSDSGCPKLDNFLHHTLKLAVPVEMAQFFWNFCWNKDVHHDFHWF